MLTRMRSSLSLAALALMAISVHNAHAWMLGASRGCRKIRFDGSQRLSRAVSCLYDTISSPPILAADLTETAAQTPNTALGSEEPAVQLEVGVEQPDEQVISAAVPTQSVEEQLKVKLVQEADARQVRKQQVESLTTQLNKSMARKQEVEDLISEEIGILRSKLEQELNTEGNRKKELQQLLVSFNDAVSAKSKLIANEEKVCQQLSDIREQVAEVNIAKQLGIAIGKKSELISIEKGLMLELGAAVKDLEAEINDTSERIASMSEVLKRLPSPSDVNQMRAYSWFEIQALQGVIMEKVTASEKRDERVAELLNKFDDALDQRSTVLEEPVASPASSGPTRAANTANSAMILRSDADVWDASTRATKSLVLAMTAAVTSVVKAFQDFLASEAKTSTQESLVTAASSLKDASLSTQELADIVRRAWMDGMGNTEDIDTTEKLLSRMAAGVSNIANSKDLRKTGSKVGENTKRAFTETIRAGGTVTSSVGQKLSGDNAWDQSWKEVGSSLNTLGTALVVTLSRQISRLVTKDEAKN